MADPLRQRIDGLIELTRGAFARGDRAARAGEADTSAANADGRRHRHGLGGRLFPWSVCLWDSDDGGAPARGEGVGRGIHRWSTDAREAPGGTADVVVGESASEDAGPADALADTWATPCVVAHGFCDDFDKGTLGATWDMVDQSPATLSLDDAASVSAPQSLLVTCARRRRVVRVPRLPPQKLRWPGGKSARPSRHAHRCVRLGDRTGEPVQRPAAASAPWVCELCLVSGRGERILSPARVSAGHRWWRGEIHVPVPCVVCSVHAYRARHRPHAESSSHSTVSGWKPAAQGQHPKLGPQSCHGVCVLWWAPSSRTTSRCRGASITTMPSSISRTDCRGPRGGRPRRWRSHEAKSVGTTSVARPRRHSSNDDALSGASGPT